MIEWLGSVVDYSHNVGIVVLVVIVEGIEEDTQTIPLIRWTENISIVVSFLAGIPNGLSNI